ncbi:MAG: bifunctional nuclease family protein [Candidatus Methylomirabilis oxyfera]|nr:bifunctional nuclease family protein [Candidatus Methylomirabilis oxyfera]
MAMKEMSIKGIHRCRKACKTALVLDSSAGWKLWIALTREEAHRIASELRVEGEHPACRCRTNSLYALIEGLLSPVGITIASVILDASGGDMVVATVKMRAGALDTAAACHTADALALAIRLRVPVFATETLVKLVEAKGAKGRQDPVPAEGETASWLDRVTPIDFSL